MVKRENHAVSGLFVFLLLGVFGVLSVLMVLLSAQAYRGVVQRSEAHAEARILPAILRGALRGGDETGAVRVEQAGDSQILAVYSEYDGEWYVTRLYQAGGTLFSSFTGAENEFDPEDGEALCPALSFAPQILGNSLICQWTDSQGIPRETRVALYAEGEEANP